MPADLSSGTVLVTGASGFIGRHLVSRLCTSGLPVRALVRVGRHFPEGVVVHAGDVRDATAVGPAVAGADTIFHLAGKAHDLAERHDSCEHDEMTVDGTRIVVRAAVERGVRRFVFFSSLAVYSSDPGGPRDESAPCHPVTPYGRAKLAAEDEVLEAGARSGMHVTCLRPAMVYGAGCRGNLARMIAMIDRGIFPPPPRVQNRRSVLYVGNLIDAALLAASSCAAAGQRYIVSDARAYSTREMFELLCAGLGRAVPRWSVPELAFRALARAGDLAGHVAGRRVGFDSAGLDRLLGSAWFSSARIVRDLGYAPTMTFEQAVPELVSWHRDRRA